MVMDLENDTETANPRLHSRSVRQIPMSPMPGPMPMPGSMPIPGPVPYYPPYMRQQYMGQPMARPIQRPMPMMPMMPQAGPGFPMGGGGLGGTSIIVEPLVILPMGIGAPTGLGGNPNQYYGANGAYPTYNNYNPYNTYTIARPNYDYNNYNNNNYNNNTGYNNNSIDYNSYG